MSIEIRPASAPDVARILPLVREYYAEDGYPFDEAAARAALERFVGDPRLGRAWVVEVGDELAGYLVVTLGYSIEYRGTDAFVDEIFLRDTYRGRGLGTAALAAADAYCREIGARALHLEVERDKSGARALYRKVGFVAHDRVLMTKVFGEG